MISIIICSIDPSKFAAVSTRYSQLLAHEPHEIIKIPDASSLAQGYNRGLAQSTGDILLFSHDDIHILTPDFTPRLKHHLQTFDVIGVAGTTKLISAEWAAAGPPHIFGQVAHTGRPNIIDVSIFNAPTRAVPNIQALDGLLLAFRRNVIAALQWDQQTFDGFHCYDIDTTFRAHLAGYKLAVANDLPILHYSHGEFGEAWQLYAKRFTQKHQPHLQKLPPKTFTITTVQVASRPQALEVMSPTYWPD